MVHLALALGVLRDSPHWNRRLIQVNGHLVFVAALVLLLASAEAPAGALQPLYFNIRSCRC